MYLAQGMKKSKAHRFLKQLKSSSIRMHRSVDENCDCYRSDLCAKLLKPTMTFVKKAQSVTSLRVNEDL